MSVLQSRSEEEAAKRANRGAERPQIETLEIGARLFEANGEALGIRSQDSGERAGFVRPRSRPRVYG